METAQRQGRALLQGAGGARLRAAARLPPAGGGAGRPLPAALRPLAAPHLRPHRQQPAAGPALPRERGLAQRRRRAAACPASRGRRSCAGREGGAGQPGRRPLHPGDASSSPSASAGDCVYMVHGWGQTARRLRYAHGRGASDSPAHHPLQGRSHHGRHRHERELRARRARRQGAGMSPRFAMAVDTRRCVGCNACVIACKTENAAPRGLLPRLDRRGGHRHLPGPPAADPLRALQPLRGRALRGRLPHRRQPRRRGGHGAGDRPQVHRLQGLHRRLPLRRPLPSTRTATSTSAPSACTG